MRFWESRSQGVQTAECSPARAEAAVAYESTTSAMIARKIMGETHPVHELRVEKLKSELQRWEQMRRTAREARDRQREREREQQQRAQAETEKRQRS